MKQKMKAITLWQPWATLVAIGAKRIETRSWSTRYRGPLAIHAAKTKKGIASTSDGLFGEALYRGGYSIETLPFGCVVATCNLREAKSMRFLTTTYLTDQEIAFGDYSFGRFAWMLDSVQKVDPPIPARGYQGLWNIEFEVVG